MWDYPWRLASGGDVWARHIHNPSMPSARGSRMLLALIMTRRLDPADLPESVARYAQSQVAAGRFASIEDVLAAGVEALQARDEQEWLAYARTEADDGFAALDRGEGTRGTVGEHMARISAAVRARTVGPTDA